MNWLYEEPRHAAQRQIAGGITAALLAAAVVAASGELEMTLSSQAFFYRGGCVSKRDALGARQGARVVGCHL